MNIFTKKVFDKKAQKRKSSLLFQKGLSLIEASMVLALSAIVVSGVMYYYQAASDNNKTQSTVSEVMSIVSAVNGLYVGTSGYAGLDESVILKTSSVPENYKSKNGKNIMHPFGGNLTLGATNGDTGYYIELAKIPQSACVNLSSMNFGTSLGGVGVNTQGKGKDQNIYNVTGQDGKGNFTKKALTPEQASAACNQNENTITFLLK
ncbi:TPA: pilus assembly protein [Escherichia coli]|uniref:type 4 pilus major pilin n=1 Tax=Escherichia coli TaxID=562 RepID=UPI0016B202F0|nr:type 4 pilus major pilin [Escherichia coli]EFJ7036931.1 pilus assembly protein [Escherichia coli]MBE8973734.1 pilus assembly protein [Escherichia coli]HAH9779344.1 pilus assembly protein [Escherichia coli]